MANSIEQEIGRRRTFAIILIRMPVRQRWLRSSFYMEEQSIQRGLWKERQTPNMQYLTGWRLKKKEVSLSLLLYYSLNTKENVSIFLIHQDMRTSQKIRIVHWWQRIVQSWWFDASKGVEPQTIKLFKVCVMRHIPIFTFINKMDREAKDTFDLLERYRESLRDWDMSDQTGRSDVEKNLRCIRACIKKYLTIRGSLHRWCKRSKRNDHFSRWW